VGSGYSTPDNSGTQQTEAEVYFNRQNDYETTRNKRTLRENQLCRMFDDVLFVAGL
jgi:hypothetical protein